jgi:response regulator RpfG family c-di-GMP phosphodiesterase
MLQVYYLDDEPELCELFKDYFESETVKVSTFLNPEVAIQQSFMSPPHLWFLDFRMPGTNGDEVAQRLQPEIPKFLITGDINPKITYAFFQIFKKPYESGDIERVIKQHLLAPRVV